MYGIDLASITIDTFHERLGAVELLPSRKPLLEKLDERFALIKQAGIANLEQLQGELKTKPRLTRFADQTGIPSEYLTLLKRELGIYLPKAVPLDKIPGMESSLLALLESMGIKQTKQLYNYLNSGEQSKEIPDEHLEELTAIADLSRIYGVGPQFIRILIESGVKSAEMIAGCSPEQLQQMIKNANDRGLIKTIIPSVNELSCCVEMASLL